MPDRLIYIAGGCDGAQNCFRSFLGSPACMCSSITNNLVAYNPLTNSYAPKSPMPEPRYRHVTCALGNYIIVFGGKTLEPDLTGTGWVPGILNDSPTRGTILVGGGTRSARTAYAPRTRSPPPPPPPYPLHTRARHAAACLFRRTLSSPTTGPPSPSRTP